MKNTIEAKTKHRLACKKYRENNKEKIKEFDKNYRKKGSARYRFNKYKTEAKRKGNKWDILFKQFDLITKKNCIYCGEVEKIGIDRIDNSIGYILSNCAPCCWMCNRMKSNLTKNSFLKHCKKITKNYDTKTRATILQKNSQKCKR